LGLSAFSDTLILHGLPNSESSPAPSPDQPPRRPGQRPAARPGQRPSAAGVEELGHDAARVRLPGRPVRPPIVTHWRQDGELVGSIRFRILPLGLFGSSPTKITDFGFLKEASRRLDGFPSFAAKWAVVHRPVLAPGTPQQPHHQHDLADRGQPARLHASCSQRPIHGPDLSI
jgi:hypothetical protein